MDENMVIVLNAKLKGKTSVRGLRELNFYGKGENKIDNWIDDEGLKLIISNSKTLSNLEKLDLYSN